MHGIRYSLGLFNQRLQKVFFRAPRLCPGKARSSICSGKIPLLMQEAAAMLFRVYFPPHQLSRRAALICHRLAHLSCLPMMPSRSHQATPSQQGQQPLPCLSLTPDRNLAARSNPTLVQKSLFSPNICPQSGSLLEVSVVTDLAFKTPVSTVFVARLKYL